MAKFRSIKRANIAAKHEIARYLNKIFATDAYKFRDITFANRGAFNPEKTIPTGQYIAEWDWRRDTSIQGKFAGSVTYRVNGEIVATHTIERTVAA